MKAIVGTVPHLPWWKLQTMTDDEIREFNRKHLVEVEMVNNSIYEKEMQESIARNVADAKIQENEIWNAAIEATAIMAENRYGNYGMIANEIRKLKK